MSQGPELLRRRPSYTDFASRIGQSFGARPMNGDGWRACLRLEKCEPLPENSAANDSFRLVFAARRLSAQSLMILRATDGSQRALFVIPDGPDWAHATVN